MTISWKALKPESLPEVSSALRPVCLNRPVAQGVVFHARTSDLPWVLPAPAT
jgi:hypothetical protein